MTGDVLVVVLVDPHRPARGEHVDELARRTPEGAVLDLDATYRGVWRMPSPDAPLVHVFADRWDASHAMFEGWARTHGCAAAQRCTFDRLCPHYIKVCSTIRVSSDV